MSNKLNIIFKLLSCNGKVQRKYHDLLTINTHLLIVIRTDIRVYLDKTIGLRYIDNPYGKYGFMI